MFYHLLLQTTNHPKHELEKKNFRKMLKSGSEVEIFGLKIIANIRKEMKDTYMESATVSVQTNEQKDKKKIEKVQFV
jgi:hypothetical protein